MANLYTVSYSHRHGTDVTVHETKRAAELQAAIHVANWYGDECDLEEDAMAISAALDAGDFQKAVLLFNANNNSEEYLEINPAYQQSEGELEKELSRLLANVEKE